MKTRYWLMAVLLCCLLLFMAGCSRSDTQPEVATTEPEETTGIAEPAAADASLNSLRQAMVGTSQLFAVAYFGYHYSEEVGVPVDPIAVIAEYAPELCEDLPFLREIPADRIIGEAGDLFCIIPLDADASVAVSRGYWDDENGQYIYDDMIYSSMSGEPILIFCNYDGWEPDTQLYIGGPSGETYWCPGTNINGFANQGDCYDISPYAELLKAEHQWLKDCDWTLPTQDQLIGTSWSWCYYLEDGSMHSCELSIQKDFLDVRWNDGEMHVYHDAAWTLTYEEDYAILTIFFGEMAGVLRYNLLYQEEYRELYTSIDVLQENFPVGGEPMTRYLTETSIPDPLYMVGSWELGWTELGDEIIGAEPGSQIIEITTDYAGLYWIDYINNETPKRSYYGKDLVVFPFEMYEGCSNNQWCAAVNYIGSDGVEYTLTLLLDGSLLVEQYWELEGFRNVAYSWYTRTSDMDPYTYAISQGWRLPELRELMDTGWISYLGYALDLTDDSVPGDNGGWATVYDVGANGAYTKSYTGSWRYADGELYLSLVPKDNGYLVDDSFPVLMLDGELWIGRNEYGAGLPHFYSDTTDDVLYQPKG